MLCGFEFFKGGKSSIIGRTLPAFYFDGSNLVLYRLEGTLARVTGLDAFKARCCLV